MLFSGQLCVLYIKFVAFLIYSFNHSATMETRFYMGGVGYPSTRGVSRIFMIGFPTSGVGRYFHRGSEATSDTQLNPGNLT